ncbi:1817_t:CDS:2 [Funneliformis mosseae]|uniref:1817_t:CDS:1 n=1 Tax=Funneliformis mosseae TaxID=27381 RepID=A0A9N9GRR3_FUNMO|nr:1817_t:CDS:2 [Funneliformis mosseae]
MVKVLEKLIKKDHKNAEKGDPTTLNTIIVLKEMKVDSIRTNLMIKKNNPSEKYGNLLHIATPLSALHGCNLFHEDFHKRKPYFARSKSCLCDLGLSRSPDHSNNPDTIFGVIP